MSYYVQRWNREYREGRVSWTGPIRSEARAGKEAQAWRDAGWHADVFPSSPDVKAAVRAWQQAKKAVAQ